MKIHMVSSTEFVAKGTGVHTAYINNIDLLKDTKDIEIVKNQEGFGDIFHSHSYGIYFFLKSHKYRGKRIHTVHTTPATLNGSVLFPKLVMPFAKLYFKMVFNHADVCIAISPMVEKHLKEMGVKSKIVRIGNPVDLDKWKPSLEKKEKGRAIFDIKKDEFVILGVGQLQKRKGVEDFIEIAEKHPNLSFVWAGSRPFGKITEGVKRIDEKIENAPKNVRFLGQVSLENMPFLYAAADVFFFPSYQENSPLAPIEAAATGLPVIYRDLPEYNMLYETPYLKADNNADFSDLIWELAYNESFKQKAIKLSEKLVDQFDKEKIKQKLLELYHNVYFGQRKLSKV